MIAADILEFVREGIRDKKELATRVVDEIVTTAFTDTGSEDYTLYYTKYMPITSGTNSDVQFLGGRWVFDIEDAGLDDTRWIQFVNDSGSFVLDAGATQVADGDTTKVTYTYDKPQAYTYLDRELNLWIKNAALWVNKATCATTNFSIAGSIHDDTFSITPEPSAYVGQLIGKISQYEVRRAAAAESDTRGIYVRQGSIAIDTTKGGRDRILSISMLKDEIDKMVANIIIGAVQGIRIDLYSTKDRNIYDQGYNREVNTSEIDPEIMGG